MGDGGDSTDPPEYLDVCILCTLLLPCLFRGGRGMRLLRLAVWKENMGLSLPIVYFCGV